MHKNNKFISSIKYVCSIVMVSVNNIEDTNLRYRFENHKLWFSNIYSGTIYILEDLKITPYIYINIFIGTHCISPFKICSTRSRLASLDRARDRKSTESTQKF